MDFKYLKQSLSAVSVLMLAACANVQNNNTVENTPEESQQPDFSAMLQSLKAPKEEMHNNGSAFPARKHHKTLVNYVEQMALDLADTLESKATANSPINIAVTTLVDLDATLNNTNQLGNQLSETLIHQLQKFGYSVVDFKAMDSINVTRQGDFVLSRDIELLSEDSMANYVLAGTLIYRPNGVAVNARVINVHTKKIVASSRKLIPIYVLNKEDIYLSSN